MGQRLALIIGNSEYDDQSLARLITPTADVGDLATVLKSPDIGGFDEVITLINESASTLRRSIARLFAEKGPADLLLLYFSGHGVLDDQGKLYLAVKDTEHQLLSGTAIPAAFITDEMDRSRSKRQVLILDCCHSGAFARGAKGVGTSVGTKSAFEGAGFGRVVLTATDATQYAWEGDRVIGQADKSVFTHYLIEGLRTGAADSDNDGTITLDELYDYTFTRVRETTPKQTPSRWAYKAQGDIVIAKNPHPPAKPIESTTTQSQPSVSAATQPRPYWTLGRLAVLTLLLMGLIGPWIKGCTPAAQPGQPPPAPSTLSGFNIMQALLGGITESFDPPSSLLEEIVLYLIPILLLILAASIVLRLVVRRMRSSTVMRQAEQSAANATLLDLVAAWLVFQRRGRDPLLELMWGFWVTALGLVLMQINLRGEQIAARLRQSPAVRLTIAPPKSKARAIGNILLGLIALVVAIALLSRMNVGISPPQAAPTTAVATPTIRVAPTQTPTALPAPPPTTPLPDYTADLKGEITLWHDWQDPYETPLIEILSAAKGDYPSLSVSTRSFNSQKEYADAYQAALSADAGPDILLTGSSDTNLDDWIRGGSAADLTGKLNFGVYSKGAIESATRGDKVWAIPAFLLSTEVLYYNKSIISSPPQTTADLLKLASQLGIYREVDTIYAFNRAFGGGELMDSDGKCIADQNGLVDAVQFLLDLKLAGASVFTNTSLDETFEQGKLGMLIGPPLRCVISCSHDSYTFKKQLGDQLGIAPLPAGPKGPATPFTFFGFYVINPKSKNINGAIALAQYLTSQVPAQYLADKGILFMPVRTDFKPSDPLVAAIVQASINGLTPSNYKEFSNFYTPFDNMLRDVLDGKVSPYDGVKAACYEMNKLNGK